MAEVFKVSVSAVVDELFAPVCFETAQIDEGTDPGSQVIQMVNNLLIKAVQEEASDIHIEPFQDKTQVRFRIDGILHQKFQLPKGILNPLVSRLKVMANLDITERRLPPGWTHRTEALKYRFGSADINCTDNFRGKGCYPDF